LASRVDLSSGDKLENYEMYRKDRDFDRRKVITIMGITASAGFASAVFASDTAEGDTTLRTERRIEMTDNRAFGLTREDDIRVDDPTLPVRARTLIRIGEEGIAKENVAAMTAFFDPQFRFHGPAGTELDRNQLWAYFASCRAAFDDFTVTRQSLVSDGRDYMAARTRFAGKFVRTFTGSPDGTIEPNGKPFEYRIVNIFRYSPDDRLVEEWAQYDIRSFLNQLRG
jgi:predicted ester cyclase